MKSSHRRTLMVAACVMAGSWMLVPPARAGSADAPPRVLVRYADLNLTQPRDVGVLYGRIRSAAREVCAPYENSASLLPSTAWRRCFAQAVETAMRRVDRPLLTAYHRRQEGHV